MKKSPQFQDAISEILSLIEIYFPFLSRKEKTIVHGRFGKFLKRKLQSSEIVSTYYYLESLLRVLQNSHVRVGNFPGLHWYSIPSYSTRVIQGEIYLFQKGELIGKILSIGGTSIREFLRKFQRVVPASSPQYILLQTSRRLLISHKQGRVTVVVQSGERRRVLRLQRQMIQNVARRVKFVFRELVHGIGYAEIPTFSGTQKVLREVNKIVRNISLVKLKILIVDVRNNGGGRGAVAAELAGHFLEKRSKFGFVYERISEKHFRLRKRTLIVRPRKPFFKIPLIILTGVKCLSTTEYFIAGLKDNKRAITIGETTGGGSGNPKRFEIPFGKESFELFISTWLYYRPNSKPLEGVGIKPDIEVHPTLNGVQDGRDEVLEVALLKAQEMV